jgi:hypothetical protein
MGVDLAPTARKPKAANREFYRIEMPYCLQKQAGGWWIVLNRNYKPIGSKQREWVDYTNFERSHGVDAGTLKTDAEIIYLFNDGCPPWEGAAHAKAYLQRCREVFVNMV